MTDEARSGSDPRVTVVVITMDRRDEVLASLDRLRRLPERPPIIVVDNASSDGTPEAVREALPDVTVVALDENLGSGGRTAGAELATTPYVAFSDDDSWWAPGALDEAADVLDAHPEIGLLAARVLVGEEERLDPTCVAMADSPLPDDGRLPGTPILGFVACGAVVRREAYLEVGGFEPRYLVGGEEQLLALDLAAAGWELRYIDDVVAHHHPSTGPRGDRRSRDVRNDLWTLWLRRHPAAVVRDTARVVAQAATGATARRGLLRALGGIGWVLSQRRPVPAEVEEARRLLD